MNKTIDFLDVTPDTLALIAKELFIQVYPERMPDNSNPQLLSKKCGYDRTAQADYLANEFAYFYYKLVQELNKLNTKTKNSD